MSNSRLLWPPAEEHDRRYGLMDRMMQKRGVDADAAREMDGGLPFLEARAKCRYCGKEETCRRWLTVKAPMTSPDFCPNSTFFGMSLTTD
jgi:hypothetical protein